MVVSLCAIHSLFFFQHMHILVVFIICTQSIYMYVYVSNLSWSGHNTWCTFWWLCGTKLPPHGNAGGSLEVAPASCLNLNSYLWREAKQRKRKRKNV